MYATGACNVDKQILELKDSNPSEAIDTANILIEFESGSTATIQVRLEMCGSWEGGENCFDTVFPPQYFVRRITKLG